MPLPAQISDAQLSMAGALGAGLLVGTALAVIIPEGFHAFQAAEHDSGVKICAVTTKPSNGRAALLGLFHEREGASTCAGGALPDWSIGAVLVGGFLAMLLLDHAQQALSATSGKANGHAHAHAGLPRGHASDDELEEGPSRSAAQKVSMACVLRYYVVQHA